MSKTMKRKVSKKMSKIVTPEKVVILEQGEELNDLYDLFGVTDESDVQGVLSGSMGEDW